MLKILHLNNYISLTSGVTRYLYNLIKNTNNDFVHEIICFGGDAFGLFKKINVKTTSVKYHGIISTPYLYIFLLRYCRQENFDIIHNHHRIFDFLTSFFPLSKINSVTTVHSKVYGRSLLSYRADKLIAVSDSITKHLITNHKVNPKKIFRIRNFVDTGDMNIDLNATELRKQLNLTEQKIILYVGRFNKEKGVDILIQAFSDLSNSVKNISLVMIGEGEEEEYLRRFSDENNLQVKILHSTSEIYSYYNIADVIVLPSRIDPFPYVMLEAGLMKRPFIGSNVDGIPELVEDGRNGLLFEAGSVDHLVSKLDWALQNPTVAKKFAENLYKKVSDEYRVENVLHKLKKIYNA